MELRRKTGTAGFVTLTLSDCSAERHVTSPLLEHNSRETETQEVPRQCL